MIKNVKLRDIVTGYKYIFYSLYNDIIIDGIDAENIICNGDGGDSSLILFDSGEVKKKIELYNLNINNCSTNGPLIKIIGNHNEVIIKDTIINNVNSFGPLIENNSEKVISKILWIEYYIQTKINKYKYLI